MKPVTSDAIAAIGYDPETRTTGVQFHSGPKVYEFPGIEPHEHAAFEGAVSVGKHYHQHIRPRGVKRAT